MSPNQFRNETIAKTYDLDGSHGAQCWDYFAFFLQKMNLNLSAFCSLTGYVCDLWRLKDKYGYSKYFDYITNPEDLRVGDFAIWDRGSSHSSSHIAMVYLDSAGNPVELGQNQGSPFVTEKVTSWDILGAFRFKGWTSIPFGASDQTVNGRSYSFYRQNKTEKAIVISAGIDKTLPIRSLDVDASVMAKITGANYFQNDPENPAGQPVGMTFGDISAPMSEVWRQLPNQDSTLYFDMETGLYGDCTGVRIDQTHNVFSPSIVFPAMGNYQYARMVGIGFSNQTSTYTFTIRLTDGTFVLGLANQESTPREISFDMRTLFGAQLESVAFLDGGGSAQMGRVRDHKFEYIRETPRAVPSAVAIIAGSAVNDSQTDGNSQIQDDSEKDEEIPMQNQTSENQPILSPVKDENWSDPEAPAETTGATILKRFLSVKSFVTLTLTGVFSYLSLTGKISQEQFMSVFTMCISFFFGYSFEKKTNSKGG